MSSLASSIGANATTAIFIGACVVGGFLRVVRAHGFKGLASRFVIADTLFTAGSGAVYPYLVPGVLLDKIPALVVAVALVGLTYAGNLTLVALARKVGLLPENGKLDNTNGGTNP